MVDFTLKNRITEGPPLPSIHFAVKIPKIVMQNTSDPQPISAVIQRDSNLVPWLSQVYI